MDDLSFFCRCGICFCELSGTVKPNGQSYPETVSCTCPNCGALLGFDVWQPPEYSEPRVMHMSSCK
jgi:hypothetical protein